MGKVFETKIKNNRLAIFQKSDPFDTLYTVVGELEDPKGFSSDIEEYVCL